MDTTNLDQQVSELGDAAGKAGNGRSARMLYGGPTSTLTQTVIAMREGARLGDHESPGEATMLVLRGRLRVASQGQSWEGAEGDLLELPLETHAVEAVTDAAFLLTAAKVRGRRAEA
ncbi:LuxR family transcriptional regulator [Oryzihumus sp.]|jgi:quercetin dioxygenase-like cupin family protein|uniref:LuxR family transcriptional regulator n=1 Tax=Oryzihumus sp. TaxID=1968903 RepID=UPI002ED77E67